MRPARRSASSARDIKIAHDRLQARLQEFLGSASGRLAAQESIVTLRDGRYVVPIKADFRGEVRGIVHDVSSSGATVFIEPLAVVDLANHWRELQIEERREVERILRRLSGMVGEVAEDLGANVAVLAELDLLSSAARLGEELSIGGAPVLPSLDRPTPTPKPGSNRAPAILEPREARHPLLSAPVPISLRIGGEERVLLITGPNTGGKTVALKTVGLLSLMAQAGLPVPAGPGSQPARLRRGPRRHRRRAEHRAVALDLQRPHAQHHQAARTRRPGIARPPRRAGRGHRPGRRRRPRPRPPPAPARPRRADDRDDPPRRAQALRPLARRASSTPPSSSTP